MKSNRLLLFLLLLLVTACNSKVKHQPTKMATASRSFTPMATATAETYPPSSLVQQVYPPPSKQILPTPTKELLPTKRTPDLSQTTLTNADIPYSTDPLFDFFIPITITFDDHSDYLIPADLCRIDCIERTWADPNQKKGFGIVMYQVIDPETAKREVEDMLASDKKHFWSSLKTGQIIFSSLPSHSWIDAYNDYEHVNTVTSHIDFQTSWGSVVIIFDEELGLINVSDLPLDEYYLTIEKLAVMQLEKLQRAGYPQ